MLSSDAYWTGSQSCLPEIANVLAPHIIIKGGQSVANGTLRILEWTEVQRRTVGWGGAVSIFDRAGGVDLVDGAAQLQQLPPRPALNAVPPARPLRAIE